MLKSQIPVRTWAEWDDAVPGFVEIDLVGHGNSFGEFCFTLTVTDIATGWTVNRSVRNKAAKWVFEALEHVTAVFPFPVIAMNAAFRRIKPGALSRQILALTGELETLALAKKTAPAKPVNRAWNA